MKFRAAYLDLLQQPLVPLDLLQAPRQSSFLPFGVRLARARRARVAVGLLGQGRPLRALRLQRVARFGGRPCALLGSGC